MKTRPKILTSLAWILSGVALSFPVQIVWLFGDSVLDPMAIVTKLAPLNWVVIGLSLVMIPLTLRASPFFWAAAPVYWSAVLWNNWLVASVQGHHPWLSPHHFSTLGLAVALLSIFASPAVRRALLRPSNRWWLTPVRRRVSLDARLCPVLGGEIASKTFDISEGGLFLTLADAQWRSSRTKSAAAVQSLLSVGTYCWLRIGLNDVSALTCTAEIVRTAEPRGAYPGGIGLRFVSLNAKEKKTLQGFLKTLSQMPSPLPVQSLPSKMAA